MLIQEIYIFISASKVEILVWYFGALQAMQHK